MTNEMIQQHVINRMMGGGIAPGSFIRNLIEAIAVADSTNLAKLHLGFPEYVDAVRAYQTGEGIDKFPIIRKAIEES